MTKMHDLLTMSRISWKSQIQDSGDRYSLVKVTFGRSVIPKYHAHEYYEIFWLNQGRASHRLNDQKGGLEAGDICFMRPDDRHELNSISRQPFTFTNLAFLGDTYEFFLNRYPHEARHFFPKAPMPRIMHMDDPQLHVLNQRAVELSESPRTHLYLEAFIMALFAELLPRRPRVIRDPSTPEWLQEACVKVQDQGIFSRGVAGFVEVAGRCPEYVSRQTRLHTGMTPIQIVNKARMKYAARQLQFTTLPITEIILDCGFSTTAQFCKLFKQAYGITPRAYRNNRLNVV